MLFWEFNIVLSPDLGRNVRSLLVNYVRRCSCIAILQSRSTRVVQLENKTRHEIRIRIKMGYGENPIRDDTQSQYRVPYNKYTKFHYQYSIQRTSSYRTKL